MRLLSELLAMYPSYGQTISYLVKNTLPYYEFVRRIAQSVWRPHRGLTYLVPVLFTFLYTGVPKFKKKIIPAPKG